jgi:hypothetical protein
VWGGEGIVEGIGGGIGMREEWAGDLLTAKAMCFCCALCVCLCLYVCVCLR